MSLIFLVSCFFSTFVSFVALQGDLARCKMLFETFGRRYYECNTQHFRAADTPYKLALAAITLNGGQPATTTTKTKTTKREPNPKGGEKRRDSESEREKKIIFRHFSFSSSSPPPPPQKKINK
jgi:hypothetical protein